MFDELLDRRPDFAALLGKPASECSTSELVDRIAGAERLLAAIAALQLRDVQAFAVAQTAADEAAGVGPRLTGRTVVPEVAAARGVCGTTARHQVDLARVVVKDHPRMFELLLAGSVSMAGVRRVVEHTEVLEPGLRHRVDAAVADWVRRRDSHTPAQLGQAAARMVIAVDPKAAMARCEVARADARVTVFDRRDGTATVWAKLKAEDAVAVSLSVPA